MFLYYMYKKNAETAVQSRIPPCAGFFAIIFVDERDISGLCTNYKNVLYSTQCMMFVVLDLKMTYPPTNCPYLQLAGNSSAQTS